MFKKQSLAFCSLLTVFFSSAQCQTNSPGVQSSVSSLQQLSTLSLQKELQLPDYAKAIEDSKKQFQSLDAVSPNVLKDFKQAFQPFWDAEQFWRCSLTKMNTFEGQLTLSTEDCQLLPLSRKYGFNEVSNDTVYIHVKDIESIKAHMWQIGRDQSKNMTQKFN